MTFGGSRSRGSVGLALLGVAALVTAGAAGRPLASGSAGTNDQDFTPERQSGIPGALLPDELQLWVYDKEAAQYQVVEGDATQPYVPNVRPAPKRYKIAYSEGWAAIPFSAAINKGIYRIADEIGVDIIYCDEEFKADKAVACAEQLSQQQPDFAIDSNWQVGAAPAVMNVWNTAKVPVVNVDVVHPNGIFFGAENYVSGQIGGQAAATYAQSLGRCQDVWIFLGENPGEGAAADQRLAGFADGVQEVCGPIPADRISREIFDAGTADQALTKATDWLTGHPQAGFVLSTSIDDPRASGVSKALTQSGREGVAVGLGCDDIGQAATKEGDPAQTHFLGCVTYTPERYPDYLMSIALDVLEGKPVPNEVHIAHQFLDRNTISSVYP